MAEYEVEVLRKGESLEGEGVVAVVSSGDLFEIDGIRVDNCSSPTSGVIGQVWVPEGGFRVSLEMFGSRVEVGGRVCKEKCVRGA
ncbi:MAG: hypothetical protein WC841_04295 [Candidatus Shapirobacteria bacterium]|jgi:hypothetical protein